MPSASAQLVRRQIEALNRGDWEGSTDGVDPDVEWVVAREHPTARTIRGLNDLRAYRKDWSEALGGLSFSIEEMIDGPEVVVAIGHVTGTGAGSGAEIEVPLALVLRFRDGLVSRVEEYLNADEARGAA
jgi:ketosteroid isomerase-like protein